MELLWGLWFGLVVGMSWAITKNIQHAEGRIAHELWIIQGHIARLNDHLIGIHQLSNDD